MITEFTTGLTANAQPGGIAAEPDGNVWFTEQANPGRIGRITLPPGLATVSPSAVDYQSATLEGSTTPRSQADDLLLPVRPDRCVRILDGDERRRAAAARPRR